ncbi:MAG: thymidine phosphorylase, partial [Alphaproteobacteria bacterium]
DLREKALLLAGHILEFDPLLRGGHGVRRAREILDQGRALEVMERIIDGQGRASAAPALGRLTREIVAPADGRVVSIDCRRIGRIARLAGAPMDKGAGIDLLRKRGDMVRRGEPLYRIHAGIAADFTFATEMAEADSGYGLAGD